MLSWHINKKRIFRFVRKRLPAQRDDLCCRIIWKTGHIIREVSTPNNNIKLSNELYINFPHKLDLDTGTIVVDNNYIGSIPSDDILYNNTSKDLGKIVNKNLQNIIVFNIETVTHDASILGTDLI